MTDQWDKKAQELWKSFEACELEDDCKCVDNLAAALRSAVEDEKARCEQIAQELTRERDEAREELSIWSSVFPDIAPTNLLPPTSGDAWDAIMNDPQLARARSKLSIHEIRLIIAHVRRDA